MKWLYWLPLLFFTPCLAAEPELKDQENDDYFIKSFIPRRITPKQKKLYARDVYSRYILKGGPGFAISQSRTDGSSSRNVGLAFNTHAGRILGPVEVYFSSYGLIKTFYDLAFLAQDSHITRSKGVFRIISFGPTVKYSTSWVFFKNWKFYVQGGPLISLQTYSIRSFNKNGGRFDRDRKLTFEGPAMALALGLDEINTPYYFKTYVEFAYLGAFAKRFNVVGGTEIDAAIYEADRTSKFHIAHNFMFNFGIYFF